MTTNLKNQSTENPSKEHMPLSYIPKTICSVADYETCAKATLPIALYEHIAGGSADNISFRANRSAFEQTHLLSRALQDFSNANTQQTLFTRNEKHRITLPHPILLAPVAYQKLVHPSGELATAQAAEATDTTMVCSTLSSYTLEDIAAASNQEKWFQLYFQHDRESTANLVKRAETANYQAIVVTVDAPIQGLHNRAQRAGFQLPADVYAANLQNQSAPKPITLTNGQSEILNGVMSHAPQWKDIDWLKSLTDLPIILKGITHAKDAQTAMSHGVDGLIVSNHGGRGLDGLPPPLNIIASIRSTVGNDFTLLLDGGIQRGTDVLKALALGANAVLIGRPQMYALHTAGALGVAHMLKLIIQEFEHTMALTGCRNLQEINADFLL